MSDTFGNSLFIKSSVKGPIGLADRSAAGREIDGCSENAVRIQDPKCFRGTCLLLLTRAAEGGTTKGQIRNGRNKKRRRGTGTGG
jgi:hypothetical protein